MNESINTNQTMDTQPSSHPVSKTVSQMVNDLRYAQSMLQANVISAKEILGIITEYTKKSHMIGYEEKLLGMSKDAINAMTVKDINIAFPGQQLMPWDAPAVNDIEGDYGYTEDELHQFLITLYDRLDEYKRLINVIEEAQSYVSKMGETLQAVRIQQANKIIEEGGPDAEKAKLYIESIHGINTCSFFFDHVKKNRDQILSSSYENLLRHFNTFVAKHTEFANFLDLIRDNDSVLPDDKEFVCKCVMSYIKYAPETVSREFIVKRGVINRLHLYLSGNGDPTYAEQIKNGLESINGHSLT